MYKMKYMNRFFYFFLLFFILTVDVYSENFSEIKVLGNKRITNETIILFSGAENLRNKEINDNDLNNLLKKLYETNFFEDVNIKLENNLLTISIIENPLIQNVRFEGVKNKDILEYLNEQIQLKKRTSYIKDNVKNDVSIIMNVLKGSGYYFAEVNSSIVENDNNTVDIIYNINLGEKAFIKKIKFIGNKVFKDGKLKRIIASEENRFWKFISKSKYLDINRVQLDENLLRNFYKNNGYYNVSIESSSAKLINETEFELTFNINSGKKYFFDNVSLEIPDDFDKRNFKKINEILNKANGKHYSLNFIEKILKKIDQLILSEEFKFLTASFKETTYDNKINLKIFFEETDKIFISRINVIGNYITREKVIRNKFLIDEGDPYNEILVTKTVNSIKSTGIFKNVQKEVVDKDNKKIINLTVEEMPTGEIMAGAGTGSSGTSITGGIKEKNYLGKGIKLDTSFTLRDDGINLKLQRTDPNFNNSEKDLVTSIENNTKDVLSKFGYKNRKTGFSLGTSYEQFEDIYFTPAISIFQENLETGSKASASQKKNAGDFFETDLKYRFTLNKLNQNFQPSDGFKTSFFQSLPLISDDGALSNSFTFTNYHSITEELIFALKFQAKAVNSINDEDVRLSKRLYLSSRNLRGFESGRVGPKDGTDFIGGNYLSSLNISTTLPDLLRDLENIDFKLFYDAGNVWGVDYNSSLDSNKIRSSTGLSVDWYTPIGPLSFSLSQPITKADSDITETFRFDIGTTF
tara:strand:+ start:10091 stop:12340 length:2250 start_codon:yes stop_codon:yes gene_type:complete